MPKRVTRKTPADEPVRVSVIDLELPEVRVTLEEFVDTPTPTPWVVKVTVPGSNDFGKPFCDIAVTIEVAPVFAGVGPRLEGLADNATNGGLPAEEKVEVAAATSGMTEPPSIRLTQVLVPRTLPLLQPVWKPIGNVEVTLVMLKVNVKRRPVVGLSVDDPVNPETETVLKLS